VATCFLWIPIVRTRSSLPVILLALVVLPITVMAQPVPAPEELAQRYPPGTIRTPVQAEAALQAASLVHEQLQRAFDQERQRCEHVFFVNHCLDQAHKVQRHGDQEVRRVTLEVHALRRADDARAHASWQAGELKRQAQEELERPERERRAQLASEARQRNAAEREEDARREQAAEAQAQASTDLRLRTHAAQLAREEQQRPRQEAVAARAYADKQQEAAHYAADRARDREQNAKRRDERKAARDASTARDAAAAASRPVAPAAVPPAPGAAPAAPHL